MGPLTYNHRFRVFLPSKYGQGSWVEPYPTKPVEVWLWSVKSFVLALADKGQNYNSLLLKSSHQISQNEVGSENHECRGTVQFRCPPLIGQVLFLVEEVPDREQLLRTSFINLGGDDDGDRVTD